ncbi:uncharacterized protein LOC123539045 [Mercenaria mercenaria]|uniref:uncharacterized protein LOC123539045 n=1 Tax=Mercenaria mercenaria TaxID=6596 RepID=UPI00234E7CFC|nr:uncharacterized protein LOC123539045 [Mercenaria mercenaria]
MIKVLESITEDVNIPEKMLVLLSSQLVSMKQSHSKCKWDPQIIRMCLSIYCRSPRAYQDLANSGFLVLPSKRQIQGYKNKIDQQTGISKSNLKWMLSEIKLRKLPEDGYEGGLLMDEMAIQEDIQLKKIGDEFEIVGFVECCDETLYMDRLMGKTDLKMATHVLQILFLGNTGFRFPVGHFATLQACPAEMYLVFWEAVKMLGTFGFTVTYISLDGAQNNRLFMKMLLPENEVTCKTMNTMKTKNIFDPTKPDICIIMDYSHLKKKIRNNISKSGKTDKNTKHLIYKGKDIVWEHWYKAYQWDTNTNPLKVYHKLTNDHFFLNPQLKMRNALDEDVLKSNMLHLMKRYQESLFEHEQDSLTSSIKLLQMTSILVRNFRDQRPIHELDDSRLAENKNALSWFRNWEAEECLCEKNLISHQTREDIVSLLLGFSELCKDKFTRSAGSIVASRVNSDPIENIFSQQRGLHDGANTNPNLLTYNRTQNNIILGQTTISRKSNTGGTGAQVYNDQRQPLKSILNTMTVGNVKKY